MNHLPKGRISIADFIVLQLLLVAMLVQIAWLYVAPEPQIVVGLITSIGVLVTTVYGLAKSQA
jgi:hypothetical protein